MKTERLLLALAAITLAGCAQNEIIETAPKADRSIRFDVYTGVQTKGTETTTASIKTLNFGILGYKTSSNGWAVDGASTTPAMYNEKVTHDGTKWTYTNTKYWPTGGDKLSFFAYAPYDDDTTDKGIELSPIGQAGAPEITFTQKAAAADLVDLVVAETIDRTYNANAVNPDDNKIGFTFNHVLTKIDVKAKLIADYGADTKIVLKGLKLKSNAKLYKKATYKMSDGNWDYTAAEAWDANGALDLDGILDKSNAASWNYAARTGTELATDAKAVFSTPTGSTQHFLYMIPVANSTGLALKGDAQLEVTYDIVVKVSDSSHAVSTTTKTVDLPAKAFKKGTFTTYTLKIGLNAIEIGDVTVTDNWTPGSGTDLEVK